MITLDNKDPRPIWRQIQESMRYLVAQGAIPAETPVPSVRELAKELQVNPATVSKAYQQLVAEGVLVVRRGEGTFPATQAPAIPKGERRKRLREAAESYAAVARTLGADEDELKGAVDQAWQKLAPGELKQARKKEAGDE